MSSSVRSSRLPTCDLFRRAGHRWGLTSTLWNIADLALACGDVRRAEARLAEALLRRGDDDPASALVAEARELFPAGNDDASAAAVAERFRLSQLAKKMQRAVG